MRICVFTTAHPWDDVRVKSKFVDSFLDAGDDVTWIGPDRHFYPAAPDSRVRYRLVDAPGGWRGRARTLPRLRVALASEISSFDWLYVPDPDAALIALSVREARILLDLHEEYHKGLLTRVMPPAVLPVARPLTRQAIRAITRRCTLVTAVNSKILDDYGATPDRSLVTYNSPPSWFTATADTTNRDTVTFFHGKTLPTNGTPFLLEALKRLGSDRSGARLMLFPSPGNINGTPYDEHLATRAQGVEDSLVLCNGVPHRDMPALMAQADVGLISYGREMGEGSLPNRFFEYLALGLPVIVPTYARMMAEIVEEEGIGWTADFEDADNIANFMRIALTSSAERSEMGRRAKKAFSLRYSWGPTFAALRDRMTDGT